MQKSRARFIKKNCCNSNKIKKFPIVLVKKKMYYSTI